MLKKPVKVAQKPNTESSVLSSINNDTIHVSVGLSGKYSIWSVKVGKILSIGENDPEEMIQAEIEKLSAIVIQFSESDVAKNAENNTGTEVEVPSYTDDSSEGGESASTELDEDAIRSMGKRELNALVKEYSLDINTKEYSKAADLAEAIIEALSSGEGTEEEEENTEEEEENTEEGSEDGEEEAGIDEDQLRAMTLKELVAFVKENEIDVDTKKYKKASDLVEVVLEALSSSEGEEEGSEEEGIGEDEINAMDQKQLLSFIKDNEIDIDPKKFKSLSALKKAVIEALESSSFDLDGTGDEMNFDED
jgi:hypothetical protein